MRTHSETQLASAAGEVFDYVMEYYGANFIIHLEICREQNNVGSDSASMLTIDHYLFGCFDWNAFHPNRWHPQHRFHRDVPARRAKDILCESLQYAKLILLSNDLIDAYRFRLVHNLPEVDMDMASAVFGKGTFYSYFKIVKKGRDWFPYSQYPIGSHFFRFRGSIINCLALFRDVQSRTPHPYQDQINQWRDLYVNQTQRKRISF